MAQSSPGVDDTGRKGRWRSTLTDLLTLPLDSGGGGAFSTGGGTGGGGGATFFIRVLKKGKKSFYSLKYTQNMHLIENKAKRISFMAFLIVFWNKPMGVRKVFVKGGGCRGGMVSIVVTASIKISIHHPLFADCLR